AAESTAEDHIGFTCPEWLKKARQVGRAKLQIRVELGVKYPPGLGNADPDGMALSAIVFVPDIAHERNGAGDVGDDPAGAVISSVDHKNFGIGRKDLGD